MENDTTTENRKTAADAKSAPPAGQQIFHKRTLYLLVAFAGMLAAKLFFDFASSGSRAPLPPAAPPTVSKTAVSAPAQIAPPADTAANNLSALSGAPGSADNDAAEDKEKAAAEPPLLILNGTLLSDGEQFAIINNQIVKAGDEIKGAEVIKISANSVELEFSGRTLRITSEEN